MNWSYEYEQAVTTRLVELAPHFWAMAIIFYGLGDISTTLIGLPLADVVEAGPVADAAIRSYGTTHILLPLKIITLVIFYSVWRLLPEPHNIGIPMGLATLGILVTTWNMAIIFAATT